MERNSLTSSTPPTAAPWPLDPPALPPQPDRATLTDVALHLFTWRGYDAITPDQIAASAGVTTQDFALHFPTKDAVIMSLADEISHAGVAALANVAPNADPLDALFAVHAETLTAIVKGVGVMTRERLVALAHILTAHPHLRELVRAQRSRVLTVPLAERTSVAPDERHMRVAFTTWAAIVTGSYNYFGGTGLFNKVGFGPTGDGRVPEVMVRRLRETFIEVTGREPQQAI